MSDTYRRLRFLLASAAALLLPATAAAQSGAAHVTRADLAWRYLLMDATYSASDSAGRLSDSTRATLNRTFDRSTLSFFGGKFAVTAEMMDSAITLADPAYRYERRLLPAGVMIDGAPARVLRDALTARIARLDAAGPLAQPIHAARARAALLVDTVSAERSAEFLTEPVQLARAVTAEVSALERGRNPYARRVGDVWRSYRGAGGTAIPMRVIAPRVAASRAVGVLIALHGAGGDENMFANGYGQGIAARLARENDLLFVSLATAPFMTSAVNFDSLMTVLGRDYRLDASRVYVIGHSMGAGAAARLAQERPQALTAVVCLAGGAPVTITGAPPMLFIGAALDPVIPAVRVKAAAAATPTGLYEERANEGHTLMVRGGVIRGVAWMLEQPRRTSARQASRSVPGATSAGGFVLTHVAVVDVVSGAVADDMSVVVSGNRIVAVGPDVSTPKRLRRIDARGKFLIPGLWDMHSHALDRWEWSSLLNVANGVTGFRDPGAVMSTQGIVALRRAVERGETLGPRFIASGTIVDGAPKSRRTYVEVTNVDTMRAEIARRQRAGLDFIKVYTRLSREVFLAAAAETGRVGIPLAGHVPLAVTAAEASDAGMRSIEHVYRHRMSCAIAEDEVRRLLLKLPALTQAFDDQGYAAAEDSAFVLGLNTYSPEKCRQLGARFARNGTWFVPTLVEMQTRFVSDYPLSDEFKQRFTDPRLRYVAPARVIEWRTSMALDAGVVQGQFSYGPRGPDTVFAERAREVQTRLRMAADLHAGGASLLAGTDVDNTFPFLFFGFSLHDELSSLVKAGLSPLAALQTATINPAQFLGRDAELGTVQAGKLADMVLLDANPLTNIENTKRIAAVVMNGRYLSRPDLERLLDQAAERVKR